LRRLRADRHELGHEPVVDPSQRVGSEADGDLGPRQVPALRANPLRDDISQSDHSSPPPIRAVGLEVPRAAGALGHVRRARIAKPKPSTPWFRRKHVSPRTTVPEHPLLERRGYDPRNQTLYPLAER
jgi:hypothetical protein